MMKENLLLKETKEKQGVLIAAHRGTCGANILQNTILSYKNALLHGADMVEVDVIRSTDGVFFAFHNGQEPFVFGKDLDIRALSSTEIENLPCINSLGEPVKRGVERLDKILERLKEEGCLINVDRSWFWWEEIIEELNRHNMQEQILLKSAPDTEYLEILQAKGPDIMYMPIVKTVEEWERVCRYQINTVAAELIFDTLDHPLVQPDFMEQLHKDGVLAWVNAISLNDFTILSGGLDDNGAIADGYEENWGKLIDMGFDIIQTDWPALLKGYLKTRE